jgi:hypothetical protein
MNNRFFKRTARKTAIQGVSSWFLYQAFNILEGNALEYRGTTDVAWEFIMTSFAIPFLATVGVEVLMKKLVDTEFDIEIAVRNALVGAVSPLLLPDIGKENSVPILLYALACIDFFDGSNPTVAPQISSRPGPGQNHR